VTFNAHSVTAWAAEKRDDKIEAGELPDRLTFTVTPVTGKGTLRHIHIFNIQELGTSKNKNESGTD